jgi:hypothetical protein
VPEKGGTSQNQFQRGQKVGEKLVHLTKEVSRGLAGKVPHVSYVCGV